MNLRKCLDLLELAPGATKKDIREAYHELAKVWHPDRFPNDPKLQAKGEAKLKELNVAYKTLITELDRKGSLASEPIRDATRQRNTSKQEVKHAPSPTAGIKERPNSKNAKIGCVFVGSIGFLICFLLVASLVSYLKEESGRNFKESNQEVVEGDSTPQVTTNTQIAVPDDTIVSTSPETEERRQMIRKLEERLMQLEKEARAEATDRQDVTMSPQENQGKTEQEMDGEYITSAAKAYEIGQAYEYGKGVGRDESLARKRYYDAARDGHGDAQYRLAKMMFSGRGGVIREVEACMWAMLSLRNGCLSAQPLLKLMGEKLTSDEWEEARGKMREEMERRLKADQNR